MSHGQGAENQNKGNHDASGDGKYNRMAFLRRMTVLLHCKHLGSYVRTAGTAGIRRTMFLPPSGVRASAHREIGNHSQFCGFTQERLLSFLLCHTGWQFATLFQTKRDNHLSRRQNENADEIRQAPQVDFISVFSFECLL
ncbi:MAG: hypothetical protein IJT94_16410 [Oscillibacter sp.]|nr:hypothetical protein [Oscillibacter sp.]